MSKSTRKTKSYLLLFIKICVGIFIFGYLFKSGFLAKTDLIQLFNIENLPYIVVSSLAFVVAQILMAFRLVLLLKTIDFPLTFFQSFRLTMIGNFFNCVIPGIMGGDIVKGFLLFKDEKKDRGRTLGMIIVDRLIGIFALVCIGLISLFYLSLRFEMLSGVYRKNLTMVLIVIGFFFIGVGIFLVIGRSHRIRRRIEDILTTMFQRGIFYHIIGGIGVFMKHTHAPLYAFGLSLLMHISALLGVLILGNIVTESLPNPLVMMAISSIVFLLGIIPVTPGNIGWIELLAAYGWSSVGSDAGAEIFLYWRVITILCSLLGGLLYLLSAKDEQNINKHLAVDVKTPVS